MKIIIICLKWPRQKKFLDKIRLDYFTIEVNYGNESLKNGRKLWSWMDGSINGWVVGWMEVKAILNIAYSSGSQPCDSQVPVSSYFKHCWSRKTSDNKTT